MNCPKCGNPGVIMEGVGDGNVMAKCQNCGWTEVKDKRGTPMLTEVPDVDRRRVLTEGYS